MQIPNRFGFLSNDGLSRLLSTDGLGIRFEASRDGQTITRFFPNVGQPDQHPPMHDCHKDDLSYSGDLQILEGSFSPFYAEYILLGRNRFRWWEYAEGKVLLEAELEDSWQFFPVGDPAYGLSGTLISSSLWVSGIDFGKPLTGRVRAVLDFSPNGIRPLPKNAPEMCEPIRPELHPAHLSVFYNLSTSAELTSKFYVPVNKTWPSVIAAVFDKPDAQDAPLQFAWDAAFSSILMAQTDIELAKTIFRSLLDSMQPDGRIPQISLGSYVSNRSNPPIWFLALHDIFHRSSDRTWLAEVFPLMMINYRWFKANRMNSDYTFSWGTDNEDDESLLLIKGSIGAAYESGLDDSPLFSEMPFNGSSFDCACIDLSSLMYLANEILFSLTKELIDPDSRDIDELQADFEAFSKAVHSFFDLDAGKVNSYTGQGTERRFCSELTPLVFYPLLTAHVNRREVELLIQLLESDMFSKPAMMPSLSSDSEHFNPDGDYWRGRVWPPLVYLAARGFKRWHHDSYLAIRSAARAMLDNEWERHHHIHENYSALTGEGEPQHGTYARSCPLYSWGGLLGIL